MIYNIRDLSSFISKREDEYKKSFSIEKYTQSTGIQFKDYDAAYEHWTKIGRKLGHKYSDDNKHTLLCIICPTFNEEILLEPFIKYYSNLIGIENVIILDNNSTIKKIDDILQNENIYAFKSKNHIDFDFDNDIDALVTYLRSQHKFISKIDTDEFLTYSERNDRPEFDNTRFLSFLSKCEKHIASIWTPNLYTMDIYNNPSDVSKWNKFERPHTFYDSSNSYFYYGKSLYLQDDVFKNKLISGGNHNILLHKFFPGTYNVGKIFCLHVVRVDLIGRLNNGVNMLRISYSLPDDFTSTNYPSEKAIESLSKLDNSLSYGKKQDLLEYFADPKKYFMSKIQEATSSTIETTIIKDTIDKRY
jgi:hypothetical protein